MGDYRQLSEGRVRAVWGDYRGQLNALKKNGLNLLRMMRVRFQPPQLGYKTPLQKTQNRFKCICRREPKKTARTFVSIVVVE